MTHLISAIRGMNDILPAETYLWQHVEALLRATVQRYGYQEIRLPILEKTHLFKRSIGEATDVVEKEMYTFLDRNEESLSLRPEGTASCVRAGIEHGLFYHQVQRLWYTGPNFRYERPQKGRTRQFHQCSVEVFGLTGPDIDAEIICLSADILRQLGLLPHVELQINSLGSDASRIAYREQLVAYFTKHHAELDEDSQRRLTTNPLRILDSKNPAMQALIQQAPKITEHLDAESATHFATLKNYLTAAGISFTINPCLVRGLDYYTKTIFEWVTTELGAQGTVCAGGRYDGLVAQLGGNPTPALGFSFGLERIMLLLQQTKQPITTKTYPMSIYFMSASDAAFARALTLSIALRTDLPELPVTLHCGGGSLKNQFKKADKSNAQIALILGDDELNKGTVAIKFLREDKPQMEVAQTELADTLQTIIRSPREGHRDPLLKGWIPT